MEKVKVFSLFMTLYHLCREIVIFREQLWQIFLPDRVVVGILRNNRLNRDLLKSEIRKMQYIL